MVDVPEIHRDWYDIDGSDSTARFRPLERDVLMDCSGEKGGFKSISVKDDSNGDGKNYWRWQGSCMKLGENVGEHDEFEGKP